MAWRVAQFADGLAEAPSESLMRTLCLTYGLPIPELQVELFDSRGLIWRVDGLLRAFRVVLEVDGKGKYADRETLWREKVREDRLREAGWEVVRLTWEDVFSSPERAAARIRGAISRAARLRPAA